MSYHGKHRRSSVVKPLAAVAAVAVAPLAFAAPAHAGDGVPPRWEDVVECESGGDPNAVNPSSGAAGLYQFMPSTWDAYAPPGYPDSPLGASAHQQLVVAERVLAAQGADAWVCPGAPASSTNVDADVSPSVAVGDDNSTGHECRDPADLAWESCDVLPSGRTQAEVYASADADAQAETQADAQAEGSVRVGVDLDGDGDGDYRGISQPRFFYFETADPGNRGEWVSP